MFRRRRRGLTVLPSYAGGSYFSTNTQTGAHSQRISQNQNQGPYAAYPMSNQQAWGGYQPPPGPPPPQDEQAPPPPYPGKPKPYDGEENSGYGYPRSPQQEAPKPGGFVVPGSQPQSPSSPPPAHVHPNVSFLHRLLSSAVLMSPPRSRLGSGVPDYRL